VVAVLVDDDSVLGTEAAAVAGARRRVAAGEGEASIGRPVVLDHSVAGYLVAEDVDAASPARGLGGRRTDQR